MPKVEVTSKLERYVDCPFLEVGGNSVREVLSESFRRCPSLRDHLLDDQGRVRRHIALFVDGQIVQDRQGLTDAVSENSTVFVMQALYGAGGGS